MRGARLVLLAVLVALTAAGTAVATTVPGVPDPTVAAARETEPVVLQGSAFPSWAAPADVSVKVPSLAGAQCLDGSNTCTHNTYEKPEVSTGAALGAGVDVHRLLGYRWQGGHFVQIPFQVDEMAQRYISNNA